MGGKSKYKCKMGGIQYLIVKRTHGQQMDILTISDQFLREIVVYKGKQ